LKNLNDLILTEFKEILLLDKKYKDKEDLIESLVNNFFKYNEQLFKNDKESEEQVLALIYSLGILYEDISTVVSGIYFILNRSIIINKELNKHRQENYDLKLIEKDINNISKTINTYKDLLEKARILNNDNDIFKYDFVISMLNKFKQNKDDALAIYISSFTGAFIEKYSTNEYKEQLEKFKLKENPNYNIELNKKLLDNIEYFYDIYCLLQGYRLSDRKIFKSAALRVYNLVLNNLNIKSKKQLADKVSHLFARLGIDVNIDYRKAHNIREVSSYDEYIIYDYTTNKKDTNLYLHIENTINNIIKNVGDELSTINYPLNSIQTNKKAMYIKNCNLYQKDYKKIQYIN
jgi:hypothetical protein